MKNTYNKQLYTDYKKDVIIKCSNGKIVRNGWIHISIDKKGVYVYIAREHYRIYWILRGNKSDPNLKIKLVDDNQTIYFNTYQVKFLKKEEYDSIKHCISFIKFRSRFLV